jgi:benzoyl-CoA-dihydrodiol lyase
MEQTIAAAVTFDTHPSRYRHWKLSFDGAIATLAMDVREDAGLRDDYRLKLNSYDLGVDIELADAIQRIRFEHPETRAVVITSAKERVFCAGANIYMLGASPHAFKVNFCKFTNETRLAMEDASLHSGLKFLCAVNGSCAGGGYELALACDEIVLVDDGSSAVSLPETPLLAVLPGTGGLKGQRAVEWRLVDAVYPKSRFDEELARRATELAASSDRPKAASGIELRPLDVRVTDVSVAYSAVVLSIDRVRRTAELTIHAPEAPEPDSPDGIVAAGDQFWPLRAFRELDDALLRVRINEPEIGTIVVRTSGDGAAILAIDRTLHEHRANWLVREVILFIQRTLKRLDLTSRSFFALIEPGSAFAGTLFDVALACDRAYMLADPDRPNTIVLSAMNHGAYPMSNGLSRLESRFLGEPARVDAAFAHDGAFDAEAALEAGLVTSAPDDLDWDDEVRLAIEARAALSPDALTAMEANLRFAGPETLETKIFGRLSAWQNWIFQRPNASGDRGALKGYGREGRAEFDWKRC